MLTTAAQTTPAENGALIKDSTTKDFMVDVIEESRKQPVLIDFWAPWCGPCKQLTPILEKAVREAKGKVKLVKINTDEHPAIPGQLGVRSIPHVFVAKDGQLMDGFTGALPESQIKQFIELVAGKSGPSDAETLLTEAEAALSAGDAAAAIELFSAVLEHEPESVKAHGGLAQAFLKAGHLEEAKGVLEAVPEDKRSDAAVAAAQAAIDLAEKAAALGDLQPLLARIEADPKDHQARFDLALGLAAAGKREEAIDHLMEIVKRDRNWNEDGARKQLVQFFEAWGPMDEATVLGRRKLSAVLFA
jgi:putative thioredoxin